MLNPDYGCKLFKVVHRISEATTTTTTIKVSNLWALFVCCHYRFGVSYEDIFLLCTLSWDWNNFHDIFFSNSLRVIFSNSSRQCGNIVGDDWESMEDAPELYVRVALVDIVFYMRNDNFSWLSFCSSFFFSKCPVYSPSWCLSLLQHSLHLMTLTQFLESSCSLHTPEPLNSVQFVQSMGMNLRESPFLPPPLSFSPFSPSPFLFFSPMPTFSSYARHYSNRAFNKSWMMPATGHNT